jgi:hypothetical protein
MTECSSNVPAGFPATQTLSYAEESRNATETVHEKQKILILAIRSLQTVPAWIQPARKKQINGFVSVV